ncbi:MAG: DUF2064 domain-containing protein [Nitrospinota bacterium]
MNSLIVFAKTPRAGHVKTRLLKNTPLSEDEVCALYRAFLCDVLTAAGKSEADRIIVNYLPADGEAEMAELVKGRISAQKLVLTPQSGENFTERVQNSFNDAVSSGAEPVMMIGSDSPTLQPKTINNAFTLLRKNGGVVLGPSGEGGLYLIGLMSGYLPDFSKIFGGSTELLNFIREVDVVNLPIFLLEELTDVDVASDLVSLISIIAAMRSAKHYGGTLFPENSAMMIDELKIGVERKNGTRDKFVVRNR